MSGHRERLSLLVVYITLHYVTLRAGVECQDTERGCRYCSCTLPYITSHYVQVWSVRTQREAIAATRVHYSTLRHITCRCGVSGHRERLSLLLLNITLHYVTLRAGVECQDSEGGYRSCSCTLPYITSHYVQVWSVRTQREAIAAARVHYRTLRHITCRCGVSGHRERLSLRFLPRRTDWRRQTWRMSAVTSVMRRQTLLSRCGMPGYGVWSPVRTLPCRIYWQWNSLRRH